MSLLRRARTRLPAAAIAIAIPLALAAHTADAAAPGSVYVLSNQPSGNRVLVYDRFSDGRLVAAGSVATGGTGTGGGLGSQGAVVLDEDGEHLYAVNAGSGSISSFEADGGSLELVSTVASGGTTPISVTVHDDVVYVLNAGGAGNISGFRADDGELTPIPGSTRPLTGTGTAPAQVQFSPDGSTLVVSEKAANTLAVYSVDESGLATGPTAVPSAGATPFGFAFNNRGTAVVSEAAGGAPDGSSVSSYNLVDGSLSLVSGAVPTTETAACWIAITGNGKFAYAGNAGSASVTGYRIANDGSLSILTPGGKTGTAAAGVIDLDVSRNSKFLYGRLANGTIGAWQVANDGSLTALAATTGLPAGAAGIAAD